MIEIAIPLLSALFSSPWAFEDTLHKLKIDDGILLDSAAAWRRQAENEHNLVNVVLDEDPDLIKGRLMNAMNYIDQETDILDDVNCKLVVFASFDSITIFSQKGKESIEVMRLLCKCFIDSHTQDFAVGGLRLITEPLVVGRVAAPRILDN